MKLTLPLCFLMLFACGKVHQPNDTKLSTLKSLEPLTVTPGSNEFAYLKEICDALQVKSLSIDALVNTEYVFSGTSKGCMDSAFTNLADSTVSLVNQLGLYKFTETKGLFYFSDVETSNQGVLSQFCGSYSSGLTSPVDPAAINLVYFTTTDILPSDCPLVTNERCIKIEYAVKDVRDQKERGRVHTREWIRIRTDEGNLGKRGFFTYRKKISEASCTDERFLGRTATLK